VQPKHFCVKIEVRLRFACDCRDVVNSGTPHGTRNYPPPVDFAMIFCPSAVLNREELEG